MKLLQKSLGSYFSNWMTTIPATIVIALLLTLFHVLVLVHNGARQLVNNLESKVTLTYYLKENADPFEVSGLIKELEKESLLIAKVSYTSAQDALALLNQAFSLDTALIEKYNLQLPASLVITPVDAQSIDRINTLILSRGKTVLHPTKNNDASSTQATDQLKTFLMDLEKATTRTLSFFLVLFGFGSVLLIASTIHLSLMHRGKEVTIMHFVGAHERTISTPFILEGLIIGFFAFLFNILFIAVLPITDFSSVVARNAIVAEFILSIGLTTCVSYITIARHLNK